MNLATYFVDRHVQEGRGDRVALIAGDRECTYAELAGQVNAAAHVLRDHGVQRGDRVLLVLSDSIEFVACWYAVQKLGAVTAEAYTYLPVKDLAYLVEYTRARVVICDAETEQRAREAIADTDAKLLPQPLAGYPLQERGLAPFLRPLREQPLQGQGQTPFLQAAPTAADDVAIWKFTTGSTGAPKACVHPARSALNSYECYAREVLGIREDDRVLAVPKLFFGYARDLVALFPFGVGATGIVFRERSTAALMFELIARHRPTILVNVPTMMRAMLAEPGAGEQDLSCLRLCTSAGEALPAELHRAWLDTFGVEVLDGIGSSEAYHIYVSNRPGEVRVGSLGREVPGYRARVVGEDGSELPDGEAGRLWVSGPTTALEYFDAPEKTAETFAGDTVMSGDLFERDADGWFYYRGRADDMLKVGGVWVAPAEIERCLSAHPDVAEVAVVGYERDGLTLPRAWVVPAGDQPPDAADLQDFVRAHLSPHKYPRDVRFLDELPRTSNGKIDRRALRG